MSQIFICLNNNICLNNRFPSLIWFLKMAMNRQILLDIGGVNCQPLLIIILSLNCRSAVDSACIVHPLHSVLIDFSLLIVLFSKNFI